MVEENKGYVYILTNPSFREDWVKIGKSSCLRRSKTIRDLIKGLNTSAIRVKLYGKYGWRKK